LSTEKSEKLIPLLGVDGLYVVPEDGGWHPEGSWKPPVELREPACGCSGRLGPTNI
jgi:hypothetical protein